VRKRSDGTVVRIARKAIVLCIACDKSMTGAELMDRVFNAGRCACGGGVELLAGAPRRKQKGKYE
jgi:hypothetical protein